MDTYTNKLRRHAKRSISSAPSEKQKGGEAACQFTASQPTVFAQKHSLEATNGTPQAGQLRAFQSLANECPRFDRVAQLARGKRVKKAARSKTSSRLRANFKADGLKFKNPQPYNFSLKSARRAIIPMEFAEAKRKTGRSARSGVRMGDVGSYGYVQYLEQVGDRLTGDHQPSGAAIKEHLRRKLHATLTKPLTRLQARNAYKKAITIVMTSYWHRMESRTYGGRNTKAQILIDSKNLANAAINDWRKTVPQLRRDGVDRREISRIWVALCSARREFFNTGNAQAGTLKH